MRRIAAQMNQMGHRRSKRTATGRGETTGKDIIGGEMHERFCSLESTLKHKFFSWLSCQIS